MLNNLKLYALEGGNLQTDPESISLKWFLLPAPCRISYNGVLKVAGKNFN